MTGRSIACHHPDGHVQYLVLVGPVLILDLQTCVLVTDATEGYRLPVGTTVRFR